MQTGHMNKYLVQITEYHGEFIDADSVNFEYLPEHIFVRFIMNTPVGGTNLPRIVAQYNVDKIYGFREVTHSDK